MHWAAFNGHKDVAELLLANKAEVNAKTNDGTTPLHVAVLHGHKDMVELLRASTAATNKLYGNSPATKLKPSTPAEPVRNRGIDTFTVSPCWTALKSNCNAGKHAERVRSVR